MQAEYSFSVPKMHRLVKQDALIRLVVKDLLAGGQEEEYALLITFNGYVLDDSLMMEIYSKL